MPRILPCVAHFVPDLRSERETFEAIKVARNHSIGSDKLSQVLFLIHERTNKRAKVYTSVWSKQECSLQRFATYWQLVILLIGLSLDL
jgi:hypothetical protein